MREAVGVEEIKGLRETAAETNRASERIEQRGDVHFKNGRSSVIDPPDECYRSHGPVIQYDSIN